jgi:hypothetical protein
MILLRLGDHFGGGSCWVMVLVGAFLQKKIGRGGGGLFCCFAWVFEGGFGRKWTLAVVFLW